MPIKIPKNLPAASILTHENVFIMDTERAEHQDIRELKILLLNLMPTKIETETQLLRLLSNTALQVEIEFLALTSYKPKNTAEEHLFTFYKTFDEISHKKYDGMIITGAPVEQMEFSEVKYWPELTKIMDWTVKNVTSTLYICWGAQAGLFYHFGIQKYMTKDNKKYSGIYKHHIVKKQSVLLRGFDDYFYVPHSRYTEVRKQDIEKIPELEILAESPQCGVHIVATKDLKQIFVTGHGEYDPLSLKNEYERDIANNIPIDIPTNYFEDNDPTKAPLVIWRSHANLIFANWLNYAVYQMTDYDISTPTPSKHQVVNIAVFGAGSVGISFIKQVLKNKYKVIERDDLLLNIFAVANSKKMLLDHTGIQYDWETRFQQNATNNTLETLFSFTKKHGLANMIFVDATASLEIAEYYPEIIRNGFNIVAANKQANAQSYALYQAIRFAVSKADKFFFYGTNVGASLPIIETLQFLMKSVDTIHRIRGVLSGSLSYIFNTFSTTDKKFSEILLEAVELRLTEPDPREDLSGNDVARKLLILGRELGYKLEFTDIEIQSLIPSHLSHISLSEFWNRKEELDSYFAQIKQGLPPHFVLRYIAELTKESLSISLKSVPTHNALGNLKGTDSIFEIYTQRYKDNPLVIQGAGAGPELTASGILSDIIRIGHFLKYRNNAPI